MFPAKFQSTAPLARPKCPGRAVIVRAVAVGVLAVAIVGCGGKAAVSTSSVPRSAGVASPAATKTMSEADQVKAWWSTYGIPAANGLERDFGKISADGKNADHPAVLGDCQQMQSDVKSYQALPRIPDPLLQQEWSAALTAFASASADCLGGSAQQAASELGTAVTAMAQLTSGIKNLYGS